jgi:hypothetical protein
MIWGRPPARRVPSPPNLPIINSFSMKLSIFLAGAFALVLAGCAKEGPQGPEGPAGPAGQAGADGTNADFAVFETTVLTTDWQGSYTEFPVDIVTEQIMNEGIVIVYAQDDFGYWNHIPSAWTDIVGYGYVWSAETGGIVGLDHDEAVAPAMDYNVRIVTMSMRSYEVLDAEDLATYASLTEALASK